MRVKIMTNTVGELDIFSSGYMSKSLFGPIWRQPFLVILIISLYCPKNPKVRFYPLSRDNSS